MKGPQVNCCDRTPTAPQVKQADSSAEPSLGAATLQTATALVFAGGADFRLDLKGSDGQSTGFLTLSIRSPSPETLSEADSPWPTSAPRPRPVATAAQTSLKGPATPPEGTRDLRVELLQVSGLPAAPRDVYVVFWAGTQSHRTRPQPVCDGSVSWHEAFTVYFGPRDEMIFQVPSALQCSTHNAPSRALCLHSLLRTPPALCRQTRYECRSG